MQVSSVILFNVLTVLVSANPLPTDIDPPSSPVVSSSVHDASSTPSTPVPETSTFSHASNTDYPTSTSSTRQMRVRGTAIPVNRRSKLIKRDDSIDARFDDSALSIVKTEMASVANKYQKAMEYLGGVTLASVDLGFDPTLVLGQLVNTSSIKTTSVSGSAPSGSVTVTSTSTVSASLKASESSSSTEAPGFGADDFTSTTTATNTQSAGKPSKSKFSGDDGVDFTSRDLKEESGLMARGGNSGQIGLTDWISGGMDILYYGGINIGTPAQQLTVDFDTGSADLWLPVNCEDCSSTQFESDQSVSYQQTSQNFAVQYGTGDVSGVLAQESVSMANTVVSGQYFGAVNDESDDFDGNPNSGVMGMAFSSISSSGKPTYFENLISSGSVASPLFGFHLARHQTSGSSLCMGCVDSSKFTSSISWVPVISKTYWSVSMTGLSALGKGNALEKSIIAAIDTGTTLIYVPNTVADDFYAQIPGASKASQFGDGFYQYPCNAPTKVTFNFDSKSFTMNNVDFNLGRTGSGSNMCVGGVLGMGDDFPDNLAIVGDEFLKSWYSVYDYSNGARVGFASSINN